MNLAIRGVPRSRSAFSCLASGDRLLQGSPNAVLPLELGQELTLCGLDTSNQVHALGAFAAPAFEVAA